MRGGRKSAERWEEWSTTDDGGVPGGGEVWVLMEARARARGAEEQPPELLRPLLAQHRKDVVAEVLGDLVVRQLHGARRAIVAEEGLDGMMRRLLCEVEHVREEAVKLARELLARLQARHQPPVVGCLQQRVS